MREFLLLRTKVTIFVLLIILSSFQPYLAHANIAGKQQLFPSTSTYDDVPLVKSIGLVNTNPSGRVGVPASFVPYFYFAQNPGVSGSVNPSDFYATISFSIKKPDGTFLSTSKSKIDIPGTGIIVQNPLVQVTQTDFTVGEEIIFVPHTPGSYLITAWHDSNLNSSRDDGEAVAFLSYTIKVENPIEVQVNEFGSAVGGLTTDSLGMLTKICLSNIYQAAGLTSIAGNNASGTLSSIERFDISSNSATEIFDSASKWVNGKFDMLQNVDKNNLTLTQENFNEKGCAYFNHFNTAPSPGTVTNTLVGRGGSVEGITKTITISYTSSLSFPLAISAARDVLNSNNLSGSYSIQNSVRASNSGQPGNAFEINVPASTYSTVRIATSAGAGVPGFSGRSLITQVVDTDGAITGLKNAKYLTTLISGAFNSSPYLAYGNFQAFLKKDESYMIYVQGTDSMLGGNVTGTVAIRITPAISIAKQLIGAPSIIRAKSGDSIKVKLQVRDQYGVAMPNASIIPNVSGRNNIEEKRAAYMSDANGIMEWVYNDLSVNSSVSKDVISGRDINGLPLVGVGSVVYYDSYNFTNRILISGGASGDIYPIYTKSYIDTSAAGASNSTVKITATLYDKYGINLPAGVKVNWNLKGLEGKADFALDPVTGENSSISFTNENGEAFTYIYSMKVGDVEVYATADDFISPAPGVIHFANQSSDARVISVKTENEQLEISVTDRYGNAVENVPLTITKLSGKGHTPNQFSPNEFGSTDKYGKLVLPVSGGDARFEVKVTTADFGQTSSEKNYVNSVLINTSSIGANMAPAGIGNLQVEVKARDFNAELLVANELSMAAATKSIQAAEKAADKADAALNAAIKAQAKIKDVSNPVIAAVTEIKQTLATLTKAIQKIQKKIG